MGAERRQTGLDALLITDVSEDVIKHGQTTGGPDGYGDTSLRQRAEQANGFQKDRLAAGVRTGDQQRALRLEQREIERNDRRAARQQERMAAIDDRQPFGRRAERDRRTARLDGVPRSGVQRIECDERLERGDQLVVIRVQLFREVTQDTLDFTQLLELEFANAIAELHGGGRLHEDRGARSRTVVNDPSHVATRFTPHRHDPATVSHRDGQVTDLVMRFELRHFALEQPNQLSLGLS